MRYELTSPGLDNEALLLHEALFHNSNGYIGVRSCFEEGYPAPLKSVRGAYINGFYDIAPMKQAEALYGLVEEKQIILNVADLQGVDLRVNGEPFSLFAGTVLGYSRALDMAKGTTCRDVHWRSPNGCELRVESRRMASFTRLPLFVIEYSVTAMNGGADLTFYSTHLGDVQNYTNPDDPRVAAESFQYLVPRVAVVEDGMSFLTTDTASSGLTVCTAVGHSLAGAVGAEARVDGHGAVYSASVSAKAGETVTLRKYCVFTDTLRYPDCRAAAEDILRKAMAEEPAQLFREQEEYLRAYWQNAFLEIDGDEDLSRAVRFNLYQLIASVGKDAHSNIAAKGLSGEGYEGHYFWDTEMYIQPFFVLTNPAISRNLIAYRYATLDAARQNARMLGHRQGALYPWRTIMGKECSGYFPSGTAQYHINGDIAYAVTSYYLATGDMGFLEDMGAEILFETARLWMDVGAYSGGRFHIHCVTGPDEYTCLVNNNYYTNVSAKHNLSWAARVYRMFAEKGGSKAAARIGLTQAEVAEFDRAACSMYLPYDEETGINPQDDSFLQKKRWDVAATPKEHFPLLLHYHPLHLYRYQVCKQADTVLAHFIFEDAQPQETIRKSFSYYENVTTHDSSLSTCIFSIVASKLGLADKAYHYFGDSAKLDLFNTHQNTKDGIHTANMGGTYMSVVYGFGGLRIKEDGLHLAPSLPQKWQGYRFQVQYQGSAVLVDVRAEGNVVIRVCSGGERRIVVYGKPYTVSGELTVPMPDISGVGL